MQTLLQHPERVRSPCQSTIIGLPGLVGDGNEVQRYDFEDLQFDVDLGPHRPEQFFLRHQTSGMLDKITQRGKGLGGQRQAFVTCTRMTAPQTCLAWVETEAETRA